MYIEPNTTIRILNNCPLEIDQIHTLYFVNSSDQTEYFLSLTKHILPNNTYQRVTTNSMRVKLPISSLYNCNYMMFKNSSFENKWYYAYITKCEYVNNSTTEITYKIDVMQTWLVGSDYIFKTSYVEREHSATDNIGDNLIEENLATGDLICAAKNIYNGQNDVVSDTGYLRTDFDDGSWAVGIAVVPSVWTEKFANEFDDVNLMKSGVITGEYNGLYYLLMRVDDNVNITKLINKMEIITLTSQDILNVFMFPSVFLNIPNVQTPTNTVASIGEKNNWFLPNTKTFINNNYFDGYQPKNNKLFTYPYNFIEITDFRGSSVSYRYEYFENLNEPLFYMGLHFSITPSLIIYPIGYKNISENYDEAITVSYNEPCSWATGDLVNFLGMVYEAISTRFLGGIASALAESKVGKPSDENIKYSKKERYQKELKEYEQTENKYSKIFNDLRGAFAHTQYNASLGGGVSCYTGTDIATTPAIKLVRIRGEYAKLIDGYFSMFGYKTSLVKKPNFNHRKNYWYIKCTEIELECNIPNNYLTQIKDCYNNGITFWKNPTKIGDYSVDNEPVGG